MQNGVGYDDFMTTIESAVAEQHRKVIDVQHLLGLPDSTPNPHLWYDPATMPKVADAIAADLSAHPAVPRGVLHGQRGDVHGAASSRWTHAIASFKSAYPGTPVATTEPVADYLLTALGADNLTPWAFQADIMNGVDPSPQNVAAAAGAVHRAQGQGVRLQPAGDRRADRVVDHACQQYHIPVVGVYETMPTPGYDYQTWMLTEVQDLRKAVADKVSTEHL